MLLAKPGWQPQAPQGRRTACPGQRPVGLNARRVKSAASREATGELLRRYNVPRRRCADPPSAPAGPPSGFLGW